MLKFIDQNHINKFYAFRAIETFISVIDILQISVNDPLEIKNYWSQKNLSEIKKELRTNYENNSIIPYVYMVIEDEILRLAKVNCSAND